MSHLRIGSVSLWCCKWLTCNVNVPAEVTLSILMLSLPFTFFLISWPIKYFKQLSSVLYYVAIKIMVGSLNKVSDSKKKYRTKQITAMQSLISKALTYESI